jgi:hypothetical protein
MRPMAVVVINEDPKHLLEMVAVEDQQPIETLRPNRPHEALRHAVGLRRTKWCANHVDPVAAKLLVKAVRI